MVRATRASAIFTRQLGPGERQLRGLALDLRHVPGRVHRAGDRGAGERRHRALRHRGRAAAAAPPGHLHCRPARRDPVGRVRAVGAPRADRAARRSTRASPTRRRRIPSSATLFAEPERDGPGFMTAGIIVAIMITPIITSITREVFATTPRRRRKPRSAMGATRWEMIRGSVFPHSRGGVVVGGDDRPRPRDRRDDRGGARHRVRRRRSARNIFGPGDTLASIIANQFGESTGIQRRRSSAWACVLLVLTVVVGDPRPASCSARSDRRSGRGYDRDRGRRRAAAPVDLRVAASAHVGRRSSKRGSRTC